MIEVNDLHKSFGKVKVLNGIHLEYHPGKIYGLVGENGAGKTTLFNCIIIIRKSKFPQNPKRSVRFSGKRTKRSVQKRKARNTQKAETKVL